MNSLISRQAAIDALTTYIYNIYKVMEGKTLPMEDCGDAAESVLDELPTLEIIRCKDCKHWNLQVGNVKGDGLGSCDFHNVNLVTGEGFCYWAEKRGEAE